MSSSRRDQAVADAAAISSRRNHIQGHAVVLKFGETNYGGRNINVSPVYDDDCMSYGAFTHSHAALGWDRMRRCDVVFFHIHEYV